MSQSFNTTRWSMIARAGGDETERREALEELLTTYMPALRAHLIRRKRLSPDLAEELLQGFIVKNVLEGQLIERADASAGKFRSWLLKWLENYVRHELSRSKHEAVTDEFDDAAGATDTDGFDADWARTTLLEAVQLMRDECDEQGKTERWIIFDRRLLAPLLSDVEPTEYDALVSELQLESKAQAQNHLVSAKRHFQRALEEVIGRYTETEEDVANEIRDLQCILAASSAKRSAHIDDEHTIASGTLASIITSDPQRIVKLFELNVAAIWEQCLDTPLSDLLNDAVEGVDMSTSLRNVLHGTSASEQLLRQLKRCGNEVIQSDSAKWPEDVGLAIYLTAIAVGQVRLGRWISSAPLDSLRPGFDFLFKGRWLDDVTLAIITQAIE